MPLGNWFWKGPDGLRFKGELDISIEFLDSIGLTPGGKVQFVVSKVPPEI